MHRNFGLSLAMILSLFLGTLSFGEAAAGTGITTRVSVGGSGNQGNPVFDNNAPPSISADGRYVAFQSGADNLVVGGTNGFIHIYVRDRQTGLTTLVSVDNTGTQADFDCLNPSISGDGRYVAFDSLASNLVVGGTNGTSHIYVHDRQTQETIRVSVSSAGAEGNDFSQLPSISSDGLQVAFASFAANLVAGDSNGVSDIFVHDLQTRVTTRASLGNSGNQGDDDVFYFSISGDGRYVAFESGAENLVAGDNNAALDIFVRDRQLNQTTRVSVDSAGNQAEDFRYSINPSISGDGLYVAFESIATNLVAGDNNSESDIFVRDRQSNQTTRVSVDSTGNEGNGSSQLASISATGRFVAFSSLAANLVAGDGNAVEDIFVHDSLTGSTTRASVNTAGIEGNNISTYAAISGNGRAVAFESLASNLVAGDNNALWDFFVHQYRQGPADFDGDGETDFTVWRSPSGTWYSFRSSDGGVTAQNWGLGSAGDNVVAGDYDGDGKTDFAVWRSSTGTWYVLRSSDGGVTAQNWGLGSATDTPVPGDYDGDGKTDFAVWRSSSGTWYVLRSSDAGVTSQNWGLGSATDTPVPGDYDGDGKTDIAVWRSSSGTWYVLRSSDGGVTAQNWGLGSATDTPVPGDYDGDGKTDFAVWRSSTGTWYVLRSSDGGVTAQTWGLGSAGDVPIK